MANPPVVGVKSDYLKIRLRNRLSDIDSTSTGRWSDATLYDFLDRANKNVVGRILFPDCRITVQTQANKQLYQMPLMLKTDAVYVAGQPAIPSDLPTLEGRQIQVYGPAAPAGTSPPLAGSDAPPGTQGPGAPAWAIQQPLSYVLPNGTWVTPSPPTPDAQPWDPSGTQPPRYYWRGGWIGIVSAPANVAPVTITVDGVRQPDPICEDGQIITSPDNFVDAILWDAVYTALFSDRNPNTKMFMDEAKTNRNEQIGHLLTWRGVDLEGPIRTGPKPQVLRLNYSSGSIFRMRRSSR